MSIPTTPADFVDFDDDDFAVGDLTSKALFEQVATDLRWLRDQSQVQSSPWRFGSDFFSHFDRWPGGLDRLSGITTLEGDNAGDVSAADIAVVRSEHYLKCRENNGVLTHRVCQLDQGGVIFEARVWIKPDAAGQEPYVGLRSRALGWDDYIYFTRGSSADTWRARVAKSTSITEDEPALSKGNYTGGWDWLKIDANADRVIFSIDEDGGEPLNYVEVATFDTPANLPSSVVLQGIVAKWGGSADPNNLHVDALSLRAQNTDLVSLGSF